MSKIETAKIKEEPAVGVPDTERRFCGIVRPIAEMSDYSAKHWREVHSVIAEAVEPLGFTLRLVSESDTVGVILSEIVTNLYQDEIVIVDVSGRNPNVMFELGMRLAFEKPAIIVMDDATPFSFDISPVKHIRYPRTLRYADIVKFKQDIALAIDATLAAGPEKRNYLQQFGPIKITELGAQSVEIGALAQDVQETRRLMTALFNRSDMLSDINGLSPSPWEEEYNRTQQILSKNAYVLDVDVPHENRELFLDEAMTISGLKDVEATKTGFRIHFSSMQSHDISNLRNRLRNLARAMR